MHTAPSSLQWLLIWRFGILVGVDTAYLQQVIFKSKKCNGRTVLSSPRKIVFYDDNYKHL